MDAPRVVATPLRDSKRARSNTCVSVGVGTAHIHTPAGNRDIKRVPVIKQEPVDKPEVTTKPRMGCTVQHIHTPSGSRDNKRVSFIKQEPVDTPEVTTKPLGDCTTLHTHTPAGNRDIKRVPAIKRMRCTDFENEGPNQPAKSVRTSAAQTVEAHTHAPRTPAHTTTKKNINNPSSYIAQ